MKSIKMKFLIVMVCCMSWYSGFATTQYANSYETLAAAINNANADASLYGGTETIILNAGLLISIDQPLPVISHTNGTIIIEGATASDGIKGIASADWEDGIRRGFVAINSNHLEIKDLIVKDFTPSSGSGIGIRCYNAKSVKITGCTFENCGKGNHVTYHDRELVTKVEIKSNTYEDNNTGVFVLLRRNKISNGQGSYYQFSNDYNGTTVEIELNDIDDCQTGISTAIMEEDIFTDFKIRQNTIDFAAQEAYTTGIRMLNSRKGNYTCELNTITHVDYAIQLHAHYGVLDGTNFGMNFSNVGSVNINTINDCKHSFRLGSDNFEFNLTGLDVDGEIYVAGDYPSSLRENLISKVDEWYPYSADFRPIRLHKEASPIPYGNQGIPSPVPISVSEIGSNLDIAYAVSGLDPANEPFVVEFFELDPNLSTIEFLGSQSVATADDATYSHSILGASIAEDSKVGMTITSLGADLSSRIGTSEVSHIQIDGVEIPCEDCEKFSPNPGEHYWLSAWVLVDTEDPVKTYEDVSIQLMAFGGETAIEVGEPEGEIIDGWQRIIVDFTMPELADYFRVRLNAHPTEETYFDDVRIHPFNGSMKSYVYDGETFWLTSELDDNNYATFYEYDQEGGLVRIKKETSRGIVTIQETRSNTLKQDDE